MRNTRTNTPDVELPGGGKQITVKRACNGCGELIGDVTEEEIERAIARLPIEDVRAECERCAPVADFEAGMGAETIRQLQIEYADELAAMNTRPKASPTFNPDYRTARCGDSASHGPHVMEHGPDRPRNCPGTGVDRVPSRVQARDEPCADPANCDVHRATTAPYPSCPQDEGTGDCKHTAANQQCPVTGDSRAVDRG